MRLFNNTTVVKALKKVGVNIELPTNNRTVNTDTISTIQTCTRILVENVSRLPVLVRNREGAVVENHTISKLWNKSFTSYLTSDSGRKIIERDRVINGNGFARLIYNDKGIVVKIIPYAYSSVLGIVLKDNSLYYTVDNSLNPFVESNNSETINADNILHFKTAIQQGFVGVSPLKSLMFESGIRQKASETITNFYKNNAMNPLVLSSAVGDLAQVKALQEYSEKFQMDTAGSPNAGKVIKLPPGMKLDTINYRLIDADIINTLKFTNGEIISAFGIPSFLMSYETTQSIENQTLEFKTFTLNSILSSYKNEIENKMLTGAELEQGYYIDFDYSVLLDADITTKTNAYKTLVTNGLCTHNEAIIKLGFKTIDSDNANKHYMQAQYVAVEDTIKNNVEENGTSQD